MNKMKLIEKLTVLRKKINPNSLNTNTNPILDNKLFGSAYNIDS